MGRHARLRGRGAEVKSGRWSAIYHRVAGQRRERPAPAWASASKPKGRLKIASDFVDASHSHSHSQPVQRFNTPFMPSAMVSLDAIREGVGLYLVSLTSRPRANRSKSVCRARGMTSRARLARAPTRRVIPHIAADEFCRCRWGGSNDTTTSHCKRPAPLKEMS